MADEGIVEEAGESLLLFGALRKMLQPFAEEEKKE